MGQTLLIGMCMCKNRAEYLEMCFSAGFQVPASHQLRNCMHGLFHDRLVFPRGTVKIRHAWRWAGGKRNYLSFIKSQKSREIDVWFRFWADAQVKSYFVLTTSPTLRRDIFRVKGWAKPREIPEHGWFCSWLDMEFISDRARLVLLLQTEWGLGLSHAHRNAHAPEQTSSLQSAGEASVTVSEARDSI